MKKVCVIFLTVVLLWGCSELYGQESTDSVYSSTRIVPRFGLNIQKGYGVELGLFLNKFYTRFPRPIEVGFLPYASSGFYIASELCLSNFDKIIIGPKLGWELGVIGVTHGSFLGIDFINYTNFEDHNPALMLKIGLPLFSLNIGYGYTIFFENNALKKQVGKHRLTATYTLNRKAWKEYERIYKNLTERRSNSK